MKYKISQPKKKPAKGMITYKAPELGDTKEKVKFAYFPVDITKTEGVWLEKYTELWVYKQYYINEPIYPHCHTSKFNPTERKLTKGWKLVGKGFIEKI